MLRKYHLADYAVTSTDISAYIELPRKGTLKQVIFSTGARASTDASAASFLSRDPIPDAAAVAGQSAVSCGLLCVHNHSVEITTSGQHSSGLCNVVPLNEPVVPTDRIYIGHLVRTGTITIDANAILFVEESA
jgi:hypothetical protein